MPLADLPVEGLPLGLPLADLLLVGLPLVGLAVGGLSLGGWLGGARVLLRLVVKGALAAEVDASAAVRCSAAVEVARKGVWRVLRGPNTNAVGGAQVPCGANRTGPGAHGLNMCLQE